jgi:DNA polymerase-3 subunit beta
VATLTGTRDDIAGALALAARFTASHKSNPQLNHLRLKVGEDGVSYVEATDQRTSIRTALYATCPEAVDILAHPDLAAAVKAMPRGDVTITQDGTTLKVSGKGKAEYTVSTLDQEPIDAFPGEDDVDWSDAKPIDASEALTVMEIATRYASRKEENPSIVGVNLRVANGQLAVESTDGVRLFHDRVDLPSEGFPFHEEQVLLPPRMVNELNRVFPSGEVSFAATPNLFFAKDPNGETTFASRRIGGKFPDVSRLVPDYKEHLAVPRKDLDDALDRMRGVVKAKPVQLRFEQDELRLHSKTSTGTAVEYIALPNGPADPVEVAFNVDYLADAIALFGGVELKFHVLTPLRPVKVTDDDSPDLFFLLAPVKYN